MRRVLPLLLALVLVPSSAAASWYRCAFDGITRSTCCCQADGRPKTQEMPPPATALRAAGCCTVTQTAAAAPSERTHKPIALEIALLALPIERVHLRVQHVAAPVTVDRPRAQGDPPDTLLARRCLLLL